MDTSTDKDIMRKTKRIIFAVLGISIILTVVMLFIYRALSNYAALEKHTIKDGWTVDVNGKEYKNVDLSNFNFEAMDEGDTIVLTRKLGQRFSGGKSIRLLTYLSTVDVYYNGNNIYSYGDSIAEKGNMVGSGYHYANLPDMVTDGDTLRIVLKSTEPNAFTSVETPVIANAYDMYVLFSDKQIVAIFISFFLWVLGIVLTTVALVACIGNDSYIRLVYIGVFSLSTGLWSMANSKFLQLFSLNLANNTFIEYVSLYLATIPFALLIRTMRKDDSAIKRLIMDFEFLAFTAYLIIAVVLHLTNVMHFPKTLTAFHTLGAICIILAAIVVYKPRSQTNKSDRYLINGLMTLIIFVGLDLLRFNIQKYYMPNNSWLSISLIPIGVLMFIVALLISYLYHLYDQLMGEAEKDLLRILAYNDGLTGIYNRTKCTKDFDELSKGNCEYALLNFDVNGLKAVNDIHGHAAGDALIKIFAKILAASFSKVGTYYRMGGDEFAVIVKNPTEEMIQSRLEDMARRQKESSEKLPFMVECSYGVAYSYEKPGEDAAHVYTLADERMYKMKASSKNARRYQA